ncbi:hypothetical protein GJ629_02480 [Halapricum sp. CBA1109]|uniref:DUF5820 family protein n=1 Tax=Halapricum sp. CBA1109 TaxID=2668068 RepID=UPI0012FB2E79|nr:DUF5820 family protein [Halapricum sp. CBA1109]MUV88899.1 hypothetical protein [Halapricum sp. CBA1109]
MDTFADLSGWTVWNDGDHRTVVVYRPDVFDSQAFPAPCLPTIYLTHGRRGRRPGDHRPSPGDPWYVSLSLEPDVSRDGESYDTREAAVDAAVELAEAFDAGEVDYRSLYQVPREAYLDELDRLTGGNT